MSQERLERINRFMTAGMKSPSDETIPAVDGIFVFCREDPRMAEAAAALFKRNLADWIVLSDGIGKDSGEESIRRGGEAYWQYYPLSHEHGVPESAIHIETLALNGAGNSRNGIDLITARGLPDDQVILVAHPRSARRLLATHTYIAREEKQRFNTRYRVVCIDDPFDATNEAHVRELLQEFLRVADWPAKGWSDLQADLPHDLVEWARERLFA